MSKYSYYLLWIALLLIFEVLSFHLYIGLASWPYIGIDDTRVLVLADPQLVDNNCYSHFVRPRAILSDKYMTRAYAALLTWHKPQVAVFLGDLFDGGREWNDEIFDTEMARWKAIFKRNNPLPRKIYVAGNHDIGIGYSLKPEKAVRFMKQFDTPLNQVISIQETNLIVLNTLGLIEADTNPAFAETLAFMNQNKEKVSEAYGNSKTNILLTHVPLYRPDNTDCGPLRSFNHSPIHQHRGYQYQNLVDEATTNAIFSNFPVHFVLSGDDHEICHVTHGAVVEETVATFNCLQGNFRPGYLMLTINGNRVKYEHRRLPTGILYIYGYLFLMAFALFLSFWRIRNFTNTLPVYTQINQTSSAMFHSAAVTAAKIIFTPILIYIVIFLLF